MVFDSTFSLSFVLTTFTVALGPLGGYILARITPEELKDGERWFEWLMIAALGVLASIALWWWSGIALFIALAVFKKARHPFIAALLSGVLFGWSADSSLLPAASFAFLAGLPLGSILAQRTSRSFHSFGKSKNQYFPVIVAFLLILAGAAVGRLLSMVF